MNRRRQRAVIAGVAAALAAAPVLAAPPEPPVGSVVVARDGVLWRVPVSDPDAPTELAKLPAGDVEVRAVVASAAGNLLVVDVNGVAGWVQPADGGGRAVAVAPCVGPGRPAADGSRFVCPAGPSSALVHPRAWRGREVELAGELAGFLGDRDELVVATANEIRAVAIAAPHDSRSLAPHRPTSPPLISPDGERAVGSYDEDGVVGLYAFRLDGTAARRKLGADERPHAWSADSQWVLLAHDKRACVVRAVGGEYKCWNRYQPVAVSPDSRYVLLARGGALYTAPIEGVEPARPKKLTDQGGPAAWIR